MIETVATSVLNTTISISVTITMIMIDQDDGHGHYLSRPVLFTFGKLNSSCFNYYTITLSIVFKSKLSSFYITKLLSYKPP